MFYYPAWQFRLKADERWAIETIMVGRFITRQTKTRLWNLVPLIQSEVVVVVDRDQPGSLTLRYTPTPIQSSRFDLYRFRISDDNNTTKERMVDDTDTKVTFVGLTPGRLYNVTVWTVSDNVESRPLLRQDRLCEYPRNTAWLIGDNSSYRC